MTVFNVDQILAVRDGLKKDITSMENLQTQAIAEARDFFNPKARRQYTEGFLADKFKETMSKIAEKTAAIYGPAMQHAQDVLNQASFWSIESIIRRARLTNPPEKLRSVDKTLLLESELTLYKSINQQSDVLGELLENTARLRYMKELELVPEREFVALVEEAAALGNAGLVYLASLVQSERKYANDAERDRARAIVTKAKSTLLLPDRELAADTIEEIRVLNQRIQTAWETMQFGRTDLRTWASKLIDKADAQARITAASKQ